MKIGLPAIPVVMLGSPLSPCVSSEVFARYFQNHNSDISPTVTTTIAMITTPQALTAPPEDCPPGWLAGTIVKETLPVAATAVTAAVLLVANGAVLFGSAVAGVEGCTGVAAGIAAIDVVVVRVPVAVTVDVVGGVLLMVVEAGLAVDVSEAAVVVADTDVDVAHTLSRVDVGACFSNPTPSHGAVCGMQLCSRPEFGWNVPFKQPLQLAFPGKKAVPVTSVRLCLGPGL